MWDCTSCGCAGIAASLAACPMCAKERDMPKTTVSSGASNAWADAEAEHDSAPELGAGEDAGGEHEPAPAVTEPPKATKAAKPKTAGKAP